VRPCIGWICAYIGQSCEKVNC